jgi:hypothetical protein
VKRHSFLYQHYCRYRDAGGDHVEYMIMNDLDEDDARELEALYAAEGDKPGKVDQ